MERLSRAVAVYDLGTTSYDEVHRLQQRLQAQRREGAGQDTLLLTEHRPVFTLGRSHPQPDLRVDESTVRQWGIEIVQAERGERCQHPRSGFERRVAAGFAGCDGLAEGLLGGRCQPARRVR